MRAGLSRRCRSAAQDPLELGDVIGEVADDEPVGHLRDGQLAA